GSPTWRCAGLPSASKKCGCPAKTARSYCRVPARASTCSSAYATRRTGSRSPTTAPSGVRRRRSASLTTCQVSGPPGERLCSSTSARCGSCVRRPPSRSQKSAGSDPDLPRRWRRRCGMMMRGSSPMGAGSPMRGSNPMDHYGGAPEIVIITGMSGAGRSTAAKSLEDLDWFVADNLPPAMLVTMLDLARRARAEVPRVAAVVDVRSRAFSTDLKSALAELDAIGAHPYVVFLEASDETLVRRFDNVRRPHPLQENGRVIDGIIAEREQLQAIRAQADLVVDTTALNIHELRGRMRDVFGNEQDAAIKITIVSFGFKYGLPVDADMVVDCRFL